MDLDIILSSHGFDEQRSHAPQERTKIPIRIQLLNHIPNFLLIQSWLRYGNCVVPRRC